ncbi:hypothetical protein QBC37DRAFT_475210 [Rhypophila decipiens]|uniref:Polyketide synthase n=1 Tax=Rhypophila decipiens TaxID=261697 RepID=A0AAN6Y2B4_9PEZI|nr:hypothetical protein QBC37DRAFT_475210 [Rhypophila decipiens]
MSSNKILFFGDQTGDTGPFLKGLVDQSKTSPALNRFFTDALATLRLAISDLPRHERKLLPLASFHSVLDLVEHREEGGVILSTILLCLAQLGDYILRIEQDSSLGVVQASSIFPRVVVGFCTGLLPAAAAAVASRNLSELVSIACHITLVSFRVALYASHRSALIEAASASDRWALAVSGASSTACQSAINRFHRANTISSHNQVYISSESASNITVSGPPSVLKKFESTCASSGFRYARLPILAAFHASHLPAAEMDSIIGSSPLLSTSVLVGSKLIDPSGGRPYSGDSLSDLLQGVVNHILQQRLYPQKAVDAALDALPLTTNLTVSILGPPTAQNLWRQALASGGLDKEAKIQLSDVTQPLGSKNRGKSVNSTAELDPVVIVGMAGRFPGGQTLAQFWDTLVQNRDMHKPVPKDRWDTELHVDPTGDKSKSAQSWYGCFLDQPGEFDNLLFNMSPRESMQTDPMQRLLLMATYEALEMAGYRYDVGSRGERVGTFMGIATGDWAEYNSSQDIDMYYPTGGLRSFNSGRLNYFFKFDGPSYVVDTACSSSGAAIELAVASLTSGKTDMAIAGGANVMTGANLWIGLGRGGFLSPTGGCKTFDETADGYCRGEGVGVVVLKRLKDAMAANDEILGVIRGISTNHSAHAASITQPHSPSQISLYKQVLGQSGLSPEQVRYVEMHGTGTQAGDVVEMTSVTAAFGSQRTHDNPLFVGGVKSNLGHAEGAAGVTGLIKTLMMFRENVIPPHAGIKTRVNPKLPPFEDVNIRIPFSVEPFLTDGEPRRALIGNFGATGGNTCLLVEEPPTKKPSQGHDPRSHHVVAVSAKSQASLQGNQQRLLDFLTANPDTRLEDVAYTSTARRAHHGLRSVFCVASIRELKTVLASSGASGTTMTANKSQSSVVFVFPGQGFNFFGLAKTLYQTSATFSRTLDELQKLAKSMDFPHFLGDILDNQGNDLNSLSPVRAHLLIVAIEIALARLLRSWGLVPDAVVGHSLGEYAALCTSGVLTVSETIRLVGMRAQLVEDLCPKNTHGMLVVQASADLFKDLVSINGQVVAPHEIACFNSPSSIVINGRLADLEKIQSVVRDKAPSVKTSYISVPYSFHSAQLDPVLEVYRQVAVGARFSKPTIPVYSTLLGQKIDTDNVFSASYLVDQSRKSVQFERAIQAIKTDGIVSDNTLFIEVGPGSMCTSMVQATFASTPCKPLPCLKSAETSWKTMSRVIGEAYASGISIDWAEYHKQYKPFLSLVELPSYHFNLKNYWIQNNGGLAAAERTISHLEGAMAAITLKHSGRDGGFSGLEGDAPRISTCLHRVTEEKIEKEQGAATIEFSTDLQDAHVSKLIEGHKVIGIALAPSSLYKEMALGAAQYLYNRLRPENPILAMDLHDLTISSPLFLDQNPDAPPQLVRIMATVRSGDGKVEVRVRSEKKEHCRCTIDPETLDWVKDCARKAQRIEARARGLMANALLPGKGAHHLIRDMVYKVFSPITEYSTMYQSISEIFIDKTFREAAVRIDLRETPKECSFAFDPSWLDAIAQAAGFLLNSDVAKPEDMMCMSTGIDTMRLTKAFRGGKQYLCHVRAESVMDKNDELVCDVTMLEEQTKGVVEVVALGEGLRFKRIKKALLQKMLGLTGEPRLGVSTPIIHRRNAPEKTSGAPATSIQEAPASAPAPASTPRTSTVNHQLAAVLSIISDEIGTSLDEIEDGMTLEDLGIDSLLSVSITSRLKTERDLELPASLIAGATTVAELRDHFSDESAVGSVAESVVESVVNEAEYSNIPSEQGSSSSLSSYSYLTNDEEGKQDSSVATSASAGYQEEKALARNAKPADDISPDSIHGVPQFPVVDNSRPGEESVLIDTILDAIAKEAGLEVDEIGENTPFSDLGLDSLMSVAVISNVKDTTGEELPANIFADGCLADLRKIFGGRQDKEANDGLTTSNEPPVKTFNAADYQSRPVLLQGRPRSEGPILFLVTDGGGSSSVYIHLPALAPGLAVYGLDSPMIGGKESDFFLPGLTVTDVASIYVRAIRSIQPNGPYIIGGYSIGGVFAYETMRYLTSTGDKVHSFLAIDSTCPWGLKDTFDLTVDICERIGMFDTISPEDKRKPVTEAQKMHVAGCASVGNRLQPIPLAPEDQPVHAFCVWSRIGLITQVADRMIAVDRAMAEERGIQFRLQPEIIERLEAEKTSAGPRGWERLVGNHIKASMIEGDHYSIMMRPRVKEDLGPLLQSHVKQMLSDYPKPITTKVIESAYRSATFLAASWAKKVGCFDFAVRVGPAQRLLGLSYVTEAFATLGCPLDTIEAGAVVELKGVSAKLDPRLISALYGILADGGLVKELRQRGGEVLRVRTSAPLNKTAAHAIYEELLADAPYAVTHQLLHAVGSRLAECLTGAADATQIVFGQHRALLQEFYTTGMPDFVVASKLAAELLEKIFASHSQSRLVELLEVGAGLGGTTKYIIDKLTAAGVPFRLTYSDISPSLVSAARQRYKKQYPNLPNNVDLEYTTLDIEQPPPPSLKGRFDAIISSNCIHATKSLTTSCHNARLMLRPGGFLAMVEITNEIPWMDLVFGFMKGWWLFDDGRRHCLANEKFWRTSLESAGFKRVLTYEDTEGQPVSKGKEGVDVWRPNPQVIVACT